jgi:gliding motility-associated-like protein
MGAYLSNTVINLNTHYAIPVIPQIENPKGHFLSDTLNWMLVSGSFIASGGEQYITIGNFYVNDSTNYIQISNSKSHLTYYYIDDVSVYPCNAPVYAANAGTNVTICKGDSVQIGTAPHAQYLYSWLPIAGLSDTSIANPKASPAVTTTYYLHQKDFKFDETTDSVTVTVNPVPAVTASASPANICSDSSSTLTATGTATAYSWSNGSTGNQITVSPVTTTAYTVTGTGNYGCTNTFSLTITVKSCEDTTKNTLIIPNAFTPNGDGYNDYFKINGQNIRSINGKIFNRWGEELFKYTDVNSKWDGKYKGKDVSDGVYFYIVEVTFNNGEAREKHGSIEVVK